jgi:uncharacterized protein YegP (UPF0339 family)
MLKYRYKAFYGGMAMGLFSKLFNKNKDSKKSGNSNSNTLNALKTDEKTEQSSFSNVKTEAEIEKTKETKSTKASKASDTEVNKEEKSAKTKAKGKKAPLDEAANKSIDKQTNEDNSDINMKSDENTTEITEGFTGTFEINKAKDGKKYFFNLMASNSVGIATSQMYSSAQSALTGINSVIANAKVSPIEDQTLKKYETLPYPKWEIYFDNGGKFRFRLNAPNGSCICHSQGYTTKSACKNGIQSIIKSSSNPKIIKTYLKKDN